MARVKWTDELILELYRLVETAKAQGQKQIKAIEKMAEALQIKESAVYTKYYGIIKKHGSLAQYLFDKNLISHTDLIQFHQAEFSLSEESKTENGASQDLSSIQKLLEAQNQSLELRSRIRELEFALKEKDTIIAQKNGEIAEKDSIIKRLKKNNRQYLDDLNTVKRILNRGKLEEFLSIDEHLFMSQEGVDHGFKTYRANSHGLVESIR